MTRFTPAGLPGRRRGGAAGGAAAEPKTRPKTGQSWSRGGPASTMLDRIQVDPRVCEGRPTMLSSSRVERVNAVLQEVLRGVEKDLLEGAIGCHEDERRSARTAM